MSELTPREREVADLLAEGLSNRQIAGRLYISERTAEAHAENIRRKLGVHSRTQVASWVIDRRHPPGRISADPAVEKTSPSTDAPGQPASRSARHRRWVMGSVIATVMVVVAVATGLVVVAGHGTAAPGLATIVGAGRGAPLAHAGAVAVNGASDLYVVDGNQIRKFSSSGSTSVMAGAVESGSAGDGGPATAALLNAPRALALSADGNLYIADTGNNVVRRVNPDGVISTVAGSGAVGFGGDGGPTLSARLNGPAGLALGFGNSLYIA
ncbi:MAG TPA: LuxR C-terminal-related transcriptional regulator, partial [Acidimicrobiales bacterium]|nr:LuxR C-terminal-related transcriptional regulator [Acidimicrobiales bacterium]